MDWERMRYGPGKDEVWNWKRRGCWRRLGEQAKCGSRVGQTNNRFDHRFWAECQMLNLLSGSLLSSNAYFWCSLTGLLNWRGVESHRS